MPDELVVDEQQPDVEVVEEQVETTAAPEGQAAEPQAPVTEPEPKPKAQPQQPSMAEREVQWLRKTVGDLTTQQRRLLAELEEYRYAGMDPNEAEAAKLQKEREDLEQRRRDYEIQQARQEWQQYYRGFGATDEMLAGDDPITWQNNVLTNQHKQITDLLEQVEAYKKATAQPQAPKVTQKSGGATHKKTIWDYSLEEVQALTEKARHGLLDAADVPPLS